MYKANYIYKTNRSTLNWYHFKMWNKNNLKIFNLSFELISFALNTRAIFNIHLNWHDESGIELCSKLHKLKKKLHATCTCNGNLPTHPMMWKKYQLRFLVNMFNEIKETYMIICINLRTTTTDTPPSSNV